MIIKKYRHPFLFYGLATAVPWTVWFIAAYLSHLESGSKVNIITGGVLGVIGLAGPLAIALRLILSDPDLKKDLKKRIFSVTNVKPFYLITACFLMLASILLAQAVSLIFGFSIEQFKLSGHFSFSYAIFPAWFMLILAPLLEELAWHSYGTDSLRSRFNLFTTSLIFAIYWAAWHFPLSFIKDYYHSNLVEIGWIYSLNFYVSIIPFVLIMNWLYYKTGRNIVITILFHISAGFFNEIFSTHPVSKVIQTLLLIALSIILVFRERDFFFEHDYHESNI